MKQRHHTPEQVIRKLADGDILLNEGKDPAEICRQLEQIDVAPMEEPVRRHEGHRCQVSEGARD